MREADVRCATLHGANLRGADLTGATLPPWDSGLLEGVRLAEAVGWVPANKDLRKAKLKGADLSGCDLSGCDMREADVSGAILEGANLKGARLQGALGGRTTSVQVPGSCTNIISVFYPPVQRATGG